METHITDFSIAPECSGTKPAPEQSDNEPNNIIEKLPVEDAQFCRLQQIAYDKSREALGELLEKCERLSNELRFLLGDFQYSTYMGDLFYRIPSSLEDALITSSEVLIRTITRHFEQEYLISFDTESIIGALIPAKPSSNDRERSPADRAKYEQMMQNFHLHCERILECIFDQLDGNTLEERAIEDIKARCQGIAWDKDGTCRYFQRQKSITFMSLTCIYKHYGQVCGITPAEGMEHIFSAITLFENGHPVPMNEVLYDLCHRTLEIEAGSYKTGLKKVPQLKVYKNGRVDFIFSHAKYTKQFAAQFLAA